MIMFTMKMMYTKHGIGKINIDSESDLKLYMVMEWLKYTIKTIFD